MKYTLTLILLAVMMQGCENESPYSKLSRLKHPVIVLAKTDTRFYVDNSIALIDSSGEIVTINVGYCIGDALYSTFKIGDTIKH